MGYNLITGTIKALSNSPLPITRGGFFAFKIMIDTKADINRVRALLEQGKRYSDIGRELGRSGERIRQIAKANGWTRKPFDYTIPKPKNWLTALRESGKPWCGMCKAQDVPLMIHASRGGIQWHRCRKCNKEAMRAYYKTEHGNKIVREIANRSYHKLKHKDRENP